MTPQISFKEVKKHKNSSSTWMVIHNDVYDVTKFLNEHPGGPDSLLEFAGLDGTQGFEDAGHSYDAREMMKQYKIGTLPPDEHTKPVETCSPRIPKPEPTQKTWRTYDGSSSSRYVQPKSDYKGPPATPRAERRIQAIVVPRESSKLKWALLALAGAIVVGIALKKYVG